MFATPTSEFPAPLRPVLLFVVSGAAPPTQRTAALLVNTVGSVGGSILVAIMTGWIMIVWIMTVWIMTVWTPRLSLLSGQEVSEQKDEEHFDDLG